MGLGLDTKATLAVRRVGLSLRNQRLSPSVDQMG